LTKIILSDKLNFPLKKENIMRYFKKLCNNAVVFLLFITIFSSRLYCYIDPGTGSYFIQLIIAGLIGVPFAIKLF